MPGYVRQSCRRSSCSRWTMLPLWLQQCLQCSIEGPAGRFLLGSVPQAAASDDQLIVVEPCSPHCRQSLQCCIEAGLQVSLNVPAGILLYKEAILLGLPILLAALCSCCSAFIACRAPHPLLSLLRPCVWLLKLCWPFRIEDCLPLGFDVE